MNAVHQSIESGVHRLETLMAQSRHDPAFNDLNCNFDLGFLASQQLPVMKIVV